MKTIREIKDMIQTLNLKDHMNLASILLAITERLEDLENTTNESAHAISCMRNGITPD